MSTDIRSDIRADIRPISPGTLIRVEIRKLVDTLAGRWLLIAIAGLTFVVLLGIWFTAEPSSINLEDFLRGSSGPLMMLLPVLGILAATSEWSQRTGLVTFTLEPRRTRVLLAKLVAALIVGLGAVILVFALAAGLTWLAAALKDPIDPWQLPAAVATGFVAALLLSLAQGVAFGTIIPNTPAAIVVYFLLPILWTFLMLWEVMARVRPWLDLGDAMQPLFAGRMNGEDWAHIAVASSVWVVLPLVIGAIILNRRDVK